MMRKLLVIPLLLLLLVPVAGASDTIYILTIDGVINQGVEDYITRGIDYAQKHDGSAIIIEIDTGGGSADAMNGIIKEIESSSIPIITYVTPRGAHAFSAGTFILMTSPVCAMSPGTAIGACEPVRLSSTGGVESAGEKVRNAYAAKMVSLAQEHQRNTTIARDFVMKDLSLTAEEALNTGIIDLIASDRMELIGKLEEMDVVEDGSDLVPIKPTIKEGFMKTITDPTVASLLFTLGLMLLIFGIISPGLYPESIGTIFLVLGIYSMGIIGANIIGLILIALGIIFFILEIKTPTFGFFTAVAILSLILGAFMILPSPTTPKYHYVSEAWLREYRLTMIAIIATLTAILSFVLVMVVKTQKKEMESGKESIGGTEGVALTDINPEGKVKMMGEIWMAESVEGEIIKGEKVIVERSEGLKLYVRKR
jgi:membrane-bound serine protease (ClpP class)